MVVGALGFFVASLESGAVERRCVGGLIGPKQVDSDRVVKVEVALQRFEIDCAGATNLDRVFGLQLFHHIASALDDARHTRFADEHVMSFLGQHEFGCSRQRVESRLRQRRKLELAVAIGEVREHVKRQPIRCSFVERSKDSRVVGVARATVQHGFSLLTTIAPEVAMKQVHHGPQVPALLDVYLEQVTQIV